MKADALEKGPVTTTNNAGSAVEHLNFIKESTSLTVPELRERYLSSLAEGRTAVVVGLAGITGAGKTYASELLSGHQFTSGVKLLPRLPRPGEGSNYRPWVNTESASQLGLVPPHTFDTTVPKDILLGDVAFGGIYAIPAATVRDNLSVGNSVAVILGRSEENYLFAEGVREVLPLAPVALVQLEAPLKILRDRMMQRGVSAEELERRLHAMEVYERSDQRQMAALSSAYNIACIYNLSESEINRFGYSPKNIQPTTQETLLQTVSDVSIKARDLSAHYAKDLLRLRSLDYDSEGIPSSVVEVLERLVRPALEKHGVDAFLIGGLSVAAYMCSEQMTTRQVSPDIDFVIRSTIAQDAVVDMQEEHLKAAVTEMTQQACEIRNGGYSPQYLSRQDKVEVKSSKEYNETVVELDCIVAVKLLPGASKFCYEIVLDSHTQFFRREVLLPDGGRIALAPPEQILVDKLLMGRGQRENKFDLFDCAGLLALGPVDISLIRRLVDFQKYDPTIDSRMASFIESHGATSDGPIDFKELCSQIGIAHKDITHAAGWAHGVFNPDSETTAEQRTLTLDGLKRLAMIDRLCASLDRIKNEADEPYQIGNGRQKSIREAYDFAKVVGEIDRLKTYLAYYVEFILDRGDIYVAHPAAEKSIYKGFFQELRKQTRKLLST
jgi:hypothetical protein